LSFSDFLKTPRLYLKIIFTSTIAKNINHKRSELGWCLLVEVQPLKSEKHHIIPQHRHGQLPASKYSG